MLIKKAATAVAMLAVLSGCKPNQASFLSSINSNPNLLSFEELQEMVAEHGKTPGSYLSLGESHNEYESAVKINMDLMRSYLGDSEKEDSILCTETISHFIKPNLEELKASFDQIRVYKGNSPMTTNFANCVKEDDSNGKYVTYSGFFHQYPFAREYPQEFRATPVITTDGNNILSQMGSLDGMFVTQMELEYLEYSSSKALLQVGILEAKTFRKVVRHLRKGVKKLMHNLDYILKEDSPYKTKLGVVVSASDFILPLYGNDKSYFLITDLGHRSKKDALSMLSKLAKLKTKKLNKFLKQVSDADKKFFFNVFITPQSEENLGNVTYTGLEQTFEGRTTFVLLKKGEQKKLFAYKPSVDQFQCFDTIKKLEVDCF